MRFFGSGSARAKPAADYGPEILLACNPILMTCEERDELVRALAGKGLQDLMRQRAIIKARKKTMMDRCHRIGRCGGTAEAKLDALEKMISKAIWLAEGSTP